MLAKLSFSRRSAQAIFTAIAIAGTAWPLQAQDAPKEGRQKILPPVNVIDKLLCAEQTLGQALGAQTRPAWDAQYRRLYDKYKGKIAIEELAERKRAVMAMSLGVKASDGVLALQGRDKEALNKCADDILTLAKRLDVPASSLQRAAQVKHHADKGNWIEAFMHLGYLQQAVMIDLEKYPERKDDALLIIMGAWLQGGRAVTDLILQAYSGPGSNILREPKLVELMIEEVRAMKKHQDDPAVLELKAFLPEVRKRVNVGLRDPIPKPDVEWMNKEFDRLVRMIVDNDKSAGAAPAPAATGAPAAPVPPAPGAPSTPAPASGVKTPNPATPAPGATPAPATPRPPGAALPAFGLGELAHSEEQPFESVAQPALPVGLEPKGDHSFLKGNSAIWLVPAVVVVGYAAARAKGVLSSEK